MIRVGWVEMADQRQKRDQVFRVLEMPLRLQLVLVDGNFSVTVDSLDAPADEERETTSSVPSSKEGQDDRTRLQVMLKETRLDLLSSLGETERYNQLFEEIPHLKGRFEGVYLEARDRSSKLLGHVRAIEHTLKTISAA